MWLKMNTVPSQAGDLDLYV